MDIYVVVEDGKVIGAATSLEGCQEIADRSHQTGWDDWLFPDEPNVRARMRDVYGSSWRLTQQITQVPLAGHVETATISESLLGGDGTAEVHRVIADRVAGQAITTSRADEAPAVTMEQLIKVAEHLKSLPRHPGLIRAGDGPAWDWLCRGLEKMANYPSRRALPPSTVGQVLGIDVVLDRNLPPNVVRFGEKVFVVDAAGEKVYEMSEHNWRASFGGPVPPGSTVTVTSFGSIT